MESRIEETIKRHDKGFNCAQAVACTYCDLFSVDEETMFRMTEGLGFGMGGSYGTCGAVTGACIIAGLKNSCADINNPTTKKSTYVLAKDITQTFTDMNGSLVCRDLKGMDTGKVLRSCPDCIRDAARLVEEKLLKDK